MKISKRQLRRIIKEEKTKILGEAGNSLYHDATWTGRGDDPYDKLEKAISDATEAIGEDAVLKFLSSFVNNY